MKKLLVLSLLIFSVIAFAQQKHEVQPKETLYGISKQYNITQETLKVNNPFLYERGLQPGDILIIFKGNTEGNNLPVNDENFIYIEIKPKETMYNLTKKYNVSETTLMSLNPALTNGLKVGDVIRLPKKEVISPKNTEGYHKVKAGETVYGISKRYNTTVEEIYLANRDLQTDNLAIDSYIKIPNSNTNTPSQTSKVKNGYYVHTVKSSETVFNLLNKYDITLDEFIDANPAVTQGINVGDQVNIPLKSETKFASDYTEIEADDTIRVAMFLPFFLNNESKRAQKRVATDFLSGAKLALDSLTQKGKKIKIKVFDSGNETQLQNVANYYDFSRTNLIVGPFYKSNLLTIADKTQSYKIPIVSPILVDDALLNTPNLIIPEVDERVLADKVIKEINAVYNNDVIYLFTAAKDKELAQYMKAKLLSEGKESIIIFSAQEIKQEKNLVTEVYQNIIPVIVTNNENNGQEFINQLETLDNNATHPFSVFYLNLFDKSTNISKLRNKGFVFVAPQKVNTAGWKEKKTLKKYKNDYCENPTKYAVYGFDIVYDLVDRLNESKNLFQNLSTEKTQLAARYSYQKTTGNAYQNKGIKTVRYPKYK